MNRSHFVKHLREKHGVDFEALWRDAMRSKDACSRKRAFDDAVETEFWEKLSETYDQRPSLYDYAPEVFDRIVSLTGHHRKMMEIGCGTGKFTLPMLGVAKEILALDFSVQMLAKLAAKLPPSGLDHLTLVHGKWEDTPVPEVDCIYCINAIYRMAAIKNALLKMNAKAREKVVLVWTLQRSIYDPILNTVGHVGLERKQEYIHLVALLYELGMDANLEFLDVIKPLVLRKDKVRDDLASLSRAHHLPQAALQLRFERHAVETGNTVAYDLPLKVALIHWVPHHKPC